MGKPIRILLIEDSERDAALMLLYLRRGGFEPSVERVERESDMMTQLTSAEWDVVISDFNLPGFNAFSALKVLKETGRRIPFIVVSGEVSEEIIAGVQAAGAFQYLCKYEMRQIVSTIERALETQSSGS